MKYKETLEQYKHVEETMYGLYLHQYGQVPDKNAHNYSLRSQGGLDIAAKGLSIARTNYLLALLGLRKGHEEGKESALLDFFAELVVRSRENPSDSIAHFRSQVETATRWHSAQATKVEALKNDDRIGALKIVS